MSNVPPKSSYSRKKPSPLGREIRIVEGTTPTRLKSPLSTKRTRTTSRVHKATYRKLKNHQTKRSIDGAQVYKTRERTAGPRIAYSNYHTAWHASKNMVDKLHRHHSLNRVRTWSTRH